MKTSHILLFHYLLFLSLLLYRNTGVVASYGALGHVPLDFQLFNFSGHFTAAQTLNIRLHVFTYPVKIILAYSLVAVFFI